MVGSESQREREKKKRTGGGGGGGGGGGSALLAAGFLAFLPIYCRVLKSNSFNLEVCACPRRFELMKIGTQKRADEKNRIAKREVYPVSEVGADGE